MTKPAKKSRPRVRSLENPRTPLDPWGPGAGEGGGHTSSGVRVTRDAALTLAGWWRGVSLIARTVGRLPILPYRLLRPGTEEDVDHQAHYLLTKEPNEFMRPHAFKSTLVGHAITEGNGYAAIERDGLARPVALLPLDPTRMEPVLSGGRLTYVYRLLDGREEPMGPQDVFHLPGFGFDGVRGYRLLSLAAEAVGLALGTQKYGGAFYRNSSRPSVVLQHPAKVTTEAMKRLREDWERIYGGADNAHRTAVLAEGMTATPLSINARDAQLIESKTFSLLDVANYLHIPPHKMGSSANVSYASLEQENQAFLDDCISPWLTAFEEECEAKLLTTFQKERGTHSISFDRRGIVIPDEAARYAAYTQGIASGVLSQDECRASEGLNPIPGGIGTKYYRPANLVELDPADRPKPAPPPDAAGNPAPAKAKPPAKKASRFDEDQPREPNGQFGSGGGDPTPKDDSPTSPDALQEKHDAEDEAVQEAREKEDEKIEAGRDKEDEKIDKVEDKLIAREEKVIAARDREDEKAEKARDREDARSEKEEEAIAGDREDEDNTVADARAAEDEARQEARDAHEEAAAQEDEDLAAAREKEDEANGPPGVEVQKAREEEDRAAKEKYDAEVARMGAEDEAADAAREKEDAATQAKRDAEDAARQAAADERQDARDREDEERDARREEEDQGFQEEKDALDAMRAEKVAERDAEDAAKEAARKKEDDERAARQAAEREKHGAKGGRSADPALTAALRALVADAARRAVRKAAHQAERAAKRPAEFLAWLEALEVDSDAPAAPLAALRMAGGTLDIDLAGRVRAALLEASGRARDADTLAAECAAALAMIEADPLGGVS